MSRSNKLFNNVPIDLPNRSGFDMTHDVYGTTVCGRLTPVMVDELLPQDSISLGHLTHLEYPPFITNFFGRVDVHLECFFVPNRLLYGGWESFITHPTNYPLYPTGTPAANKSRNLPGLDLSHIPEVDSCLGPDSLADYLGYKIYSTNSAVPTNAHINNALPFLAYHKIYNDHYRYNKIMPKLDYRPSDSAGIRPYSSPSHFIFTHYIFSPANAPYVSDDGTYKPWIVIDNKHEFYPDGVSIMSMRQRTWFRDYFTTASPAPQAGEAAKVTFDITNNKGEFTIASLRSQNSLQLWMERQDICGYDYAAQIYGNFGKYPSSKSMDKAIYLGRSTFNMYVRGVSQTAQTSESSGNPFNSVGTKYGSAASLESSSLVDKFTAEEHGYIMVLMSIVPHANYASGISRHLTRNLMSDFAFPLLQGTGEQSIKAWELYGLPFVDTLSDAPDFGYTDLYSEYKFKNDEIHGLLRDGQALSSFALQRGFAGVTAPQLGRDFLLIPEDYLDQVKATSSLISGLDAWFSINWMYRKVSTLSPYSVPTLENPKNTHKGSIPRGGHHL